MYYHVKWYILGLMAQKWFLSWGAVTRHIFQCHIGHFGANDWFEFSCSPVFVCECTCLCTYVFI